MSEGFEGPQGVQGEQGVRGIQGPSGIGNGQKGEKGDPGPQGEKCERGERGFRGWLPHRVTASFWAVVAVATFVTAGLGYQVSQNRQTIDRLEGIVQRLEVSEAEALEAHDSLCAFKDNLADRAAATQKYINDLKEGRRAPIEGITMGDLQQSLGAQTEMLSTLKILTCPKVPGG